MKCAQFIIAREPLGQLGPVRIRGAKWVGPVHRFGVALIAGGLSLLGAPMDLHSEGRLQISCGAEEAHVGRAVRRAAGPVRAAVPPTTGDRTLLYIRVRFVDDVTDPNTTAVAEEELEEARRLFTQISYGQFRLSWIITPVLPLSRSAGDYSSLGFSALLDDARAAAQAAGFDYRDADLDLIRHNPVPGFLGGYGNIGARGATVQGGGAEILVHELGHNLGLHHANFWDTSGPSSSPKISPPFPFNVDEGRNGHPFDPDSLAGHHSVNGPGQSVEYGDPFDMMGGGSVLGGGAQFSAAHRFRLGWLTEQSIGVASGSGEFRLYSLASARREPGRSYGLRIPAGLWSGRTSEDYWLQFVPQLPNSAGSETGVFVHRVPAADLGDKTLLLDTTPATRFVELDAALQVGRTFSDPSLGLHVTPVAVGGTGEDRWIEVVVHVQGDGGSTNSAPTLELSVSTLNPEPGEAVGFTAVSKDANGDRLFYHWDFGDGSVGESTNRMTKEWKSVGDYVVRCEVTDAKGGRASKHAVVRVGQPKSLRISGRVVDEAGEPVADVRVQNGYWIRGESTPQYAWAFTDSGGEYTLVDLPSADYSVGAYLYGYRTEPLGWNSPIRLSAENRTQANFVARRIPMLTVAPAASEVEEGTAAEFVFTRYGPIEELLNVPIRLGGTAEGGRDYIRPFIARITFPPGFRTAHLVLPTLVDGLIEPTETLTLSIGTASQFTREVIEEGQTHQVTFYYPGWELRELNGEPHWFQTDPPYLVTEGSSAVLTILDQDSRPAVISMELLPGPDRALELVVRGASGLRFDLETSLDLGVWRRQDTYEFVGDTVSIPVHHELAQRTFYRARLLP